MAAEVINLANWVNLFGAIFYYLSVLQCHVSSGQGAEEGVARIVGIAAMGVRQRDTLDWR